MKNISYNVTMKAKAENTEAHRENILNILKGLGYQECRIMNLYLYGSRVYGTNNKDSDYDILALVKSMDEHKEIAIDNYNIHICTPDYFKEELANYNVVYLECLFAPQWAKLLEKQEYHANICPEKLEKLFAEKAHVAWKKCKYRLSKGDNYRGLKSYFHSIRIIDFGIQIIENGKIVNFSSCNNIWEKLVKIYDKNPVLKWRMLNNKFYWKKKLLRDEMRDKMIALNVSEQNKQTEQNEENKEK
jgi:predicted nucleotidyltransferase